MNFFIYFCVEAVVSSFADSVPSPSLVVRRVIHNETTSQLLLQSNTRTSSHPVASTPQHQQQDFKMSRYSLWSSTGFFYRPQLDENSCCLVLHLILIPLNPLDNGNLFINFRSKYVSRIISGIM